MSYVNRRGRGRGGGGERNQSYNSNRRTETNRQGFVEDFVNFRFKKVILQFGKFFIPNNSKLSMKRGRNENSKPGF